MLPFQLTLKCLMINLHNSLNLLPKNMSLKDNNTMLIGIKVQGMWILSNKRAKEILLIKMRKVILLKKIFSTIIKNVVRMQKN